MTKKKGPTKVNAISIACDAAGGREAVAKACGISRQAVGYWVAKERVPARFVRKVEKITGFPAGVLNRDFLER